MTDDAIDPVPTNPAPLTAAAVGELIEALAGLDQRFLSGDRAQSDLPTVLDGYRWMFSILSVGLDVFLWGDVTAPRFTDIVGANRKWGGDNADAYYQYAPIDPTRTYRVRARRGDAAYFSLTVYGGPDDGRYSERIVATVNDQVISQSDVRNRMRWMLLRFQQQPDDQIMKQIQDQAIEDLIEEKVQLHQFYKLVKDEKIKPEEIDENITDLARGYKMTKDQFVNAITQAGIPIQSLRDMEEAKIAWGALIRGRYYKSVRVSELRIDDMLHRMDELVGKSAVGNQNKTDHEKGRLRSAAGQSARSAMNAKAS